MTIKQAAFASIDRYVEQWRKTSNIPGAVVGITDKDKTLRVSAYGYSNVDARIPPTPNTLFQIGSIGKSFACLLLLQMRDEGLVDLRKPVKSYLPWLEIRSKFKPITLHHLMTHTAGIPVGILPPGDQRSEVRNLSGLETSSAPGDFFNYSNAGYAMLGLVVEEVLGIRYEDALKTRILRPIGMSSATTTISSDIRRRLAVGYVPLHDDRPIARDCPLTPAPWIEFNTAAGPISATAGEMTKYVRLLMNRGAYSRSRIVSEDGFNLMIRKYTRDKKVPPDLGWYGYGLYVGEKNGHLMAGHSGGTIGFTTDMLVDMTSSFGVVVLTNSFSLGRLWEPSPSDFIMKTLNAQSKGASLPPVPPRSDPLRVKNSADYVGVYRKPGKTLRVHAKEKHLLLKRGKVSIVLEPRGKDMFLADGPEYGLCLMVFGRRKGKVVDLCHGSDCYANENYTGPTRFDYPSDWEAYTGHYRSFNPWFSNHRVVLRKGRLVLIDPMAEVEEPLALLPDGSFRVGKDKRFPERIRFDSILDGKATRMWYSGEAFYRTFTP